METNDIMQHIDELLQGYSNEECAEILKEVISECQMLSSGTTKISNEEENSNNIGDSSF